jgi:hypothetical protein
VDFVTKEHSFIFLILVIGGIIVAGFCFAQQSAGIAISPLTFELTANPGDTVKENNIKIYNPTNNIISIKMEVEDFRAEGETGQVVVEPEAETTYSLKRWVKINPIEFTLEPKAEKFVAFTIEVPENAEPGGKYGSILASTTGMVGQEMTGTAVAQKVGALLLLTVSGETKENLAIKEFTTPSSFFEYGPVPFTIRFENTGTVHEKPRGFVTITNWRDKKVADIQFQQQNVIPGAIRKIEASWQKKWLFGKYTAMVVGSYGIDNLPISSEVLTFWVFPWKIVLAVFLVLLLIFLFFYKTRKRWQLAFRILIKGEQK